MSARRCDLCGKHPAAVHLTEVVDTQVTKLHICHGCARSRGLLEDLPPTPSASVQALLAATEAAPARRPRRVPECACGECGLTFSAFEKSGRLGCPQCYEIFEVQLVPILRKIHAHARHAGKAPARYERKVELRQQLDDLKRELERAVRGEDYERAAQLRDAMRSIEQEQSQAARGSRPAGGEEPA